MQTYRQPLVTVEDGPTFIGTTDIQEAAIAAAAFQAQWQSAEPGPGRDLAPYTDVVIAGRTIETDPDVLEEWGRRGAFDLAEIYRQMFS